LEFNSIFFTNSDPDDFPAVSPFQPQSLHFLSLLSTVSALNTLIGQGVVHRHSNAPPRIHSYIHA